MGVPNKPKMLTKSMSTKERVLGSLKKRLKKAAENAIKKAPEQAQAILSDILKLAEGQIDQVYKVAGVKPNQKPLNVGIRKYNTKVHPKIAGQVNKAQQKIIAANKNW